MIGVLSDAHGNGPAFQLTLELLRKRGASRFVFLGDAVGYIPSVEVVRSLRSLGQEVHCIRGNHEDMLLRGETPHDEVYKLRAVASQLAQEEVEFVRSWPTSLRETAERRSLLFVHGSPADPTFGYVYPDTDLTNFASPAEFIFMGHTHRPFVRAHGGTCYVNVGSCGLPRDDGRFGSAAIFDPATEAVHILRFDISEATRSILASEQGVHPNVVAVFERRQKDIIGEVV